MGLSEPSLTTITKPFSVLSHCKVSCDSPCCTNICGEDNHCLCLITIHTKTLIAIAMKMKIQMKLSIQMIFQN